MVEYALNAAGDEFHVGPVFIVDRSVVADPYHVGFAYRGLVGCKAQHYSVEARAYEFGEAWLEQRRLATCKPGDQPGIVIDADGQNTGGSRAGSRHRAEMPEAKDYDFHVHCSKIHSLAARQSLVFSTPSRIVRCGFQPSERMRVVSRKMNGLSPIQPRTPPEYSSAGFTPRWPVIQPIEPLTSVYSSLPRLNTFTLSCAPSIATSIASMQSCT